MSTRQVFNGKSPSRLLSSGRGISLPRQQGVALEKSSPNFLMDFSYLFFDGGRRREGTQNCIFLKRKKHMFSFCAFLGYLVPWGPILIYRDVELAYCQTLILNRFSATCQLKKTCIKIRAAAEKSISLIANLRISPSMI